MIDPKMVRCPKCQRDTSLYEVVTILAWRALDDRGRVDSERGTDWEGIDPTGEVGCGECTWQGTRADLEHLDSDGQWRPSRTVHPRQLRAFAPDTETTRLTT